MKLFQQSFNELILHLLHAQSNLRNKNWTSGKKVLLMLPELIKKNFLFFSQIRVNAVNPTVVLTDMGRIGWSDPAKAKPMLDAIPLGRFAGKM